MAKNPRQTPKNNLRVVCPGLHLLPIRDCFFPRSLRDPEDPFNLSDDVWTTSKDVWTTLKILCFRVFCLWIRVLSSFSLYQQNFFFIPRSFDFALRTIDSASCTIDFALRNFGFTLFCPDLCFWNDILFLLFFDVLGEIWCKHCRKVAKVSTAAEVFFLTKVDFPPTGTPRHPATPFEPFEPSSGVPIGTPPSTSDAGCARDCMGFQAIWCSWNFFLGGSPWEPQKSIQSL